MSQKPKKDQNKKSTTSEKTLQSQPGKDFTTYDIDDDFIKEMTELMNNKYQSVLFDGKHFEIKTKYEYEILTVSVILSNPDKSYYYPVEARIQNKKEELTPSEAAAFLIDFIDLYFEEYLFEDENLFIPIDWTPFSYDAVDFQLKGQILNLKLEQEADELIKNNNTSTKKND